MTQFKQLSLEEREFLYGGLEVGLSLREIGRQLGRHHTSLSDELKRNKTGVDKHAPSYLDRKYIPCRAQAKADKRALEQRQKAPLKEPLIFLYVRKRLRSPYSWSPELIAGRLSIKYPDKSITKETIYRYIYSKGARTYRLWEGLALSHPKRRKKEGRRVQRASKIPGAISIDLRPGYVQNRSEVGHWESDNLGGKVTDTTALSVTVERTMRYTTLSKLHNRTARVKAKALVDSLCVFPRNIRKTITVDNGAENTNHEYISETLGVDMYFCHAYHSWEKGGVENMNQRLRRYIPKGTSIDTLSDKTIREIEYRLNSTPRKCLGFKTPYERMQEVLAS